MNVIPNAGAVGRVVVGPINFDVGLLAERDSEDIRNQMGLDPVLFSEFLRGAGSVEITQRNKSQAVDLSVPTQDFFEGEFGFAVRIDRVFRQRLVDWEPLWRTKNRAGRRENEPVR